MAAAMRHLPSSLLRLSLVLLAFSAAACGGIVVVDSESNADAAGAGGYPSGGTGTSNGTSTGPGTGPGTGSGTGGGTGGGPWTTTLNPNDRQESIVLSNGNLTATSSPGSWNDSVRATTAHESGKWYFEALIEKSDHGYQAVGFGESTADLETPAGTASFGCSYDVGGLLACHAGDFSFPEQQAGAGDIIGVAVDLDNQEAHFHRNGAWVIGFSPEESGGIPYGSGPMLPMITLSQDDRITVNFGASPFAYPPPAGYAPGF